MKIILTWGDEASVWTVTSEDIPGLVLEADSFMRVCERARAAIPELLRLNNCTNGSLPDFPENPYSPEGRSLGLQANYLGVEWHAIDSAPPVDRSRYRVLLPNSNGILETTAFFYSSPTSVPNLDDETEKAQDVWVMIDGHGEAYFVEPLGWREL